MKKLLVLVCALISINAYAAGKPKVAVTDITYKKELVDSQSFSQVNQKSEFKGKGKIQEKESATRNRYAYSKTETLGDSSQSASIEFVEGTRTTEILKVGELRSITGDIKGGIIKSGKFRLIQGKPYTVKNGTEEIYDVIKRIKDGYYKGADYVLFGTLIEYESAHEANPIQDTDSYTRILTIEMAAEFNLINTKTYEVISAFSASGEGTDVKIVKPTAILNTSSVKAKKEMSETLADDVVSQLIDQLGGDDSSDSESN